MARERACAVLFGLACLSLVAGVIGIVVAAMWVTFA